MKGGGYPLLLRVIIMKRLLHWIGIVALLLCGCHRNSVWHTLDVAESVMDERPDSALALLRAIDGGRLRGETQARHALLLSQAHDKNYVDEPNDSLISIATDYYSTTNDRFNQMRAGYYWTVVHATQNDYDGALSAALEVERLAKALGDSLFLARITLMIGRAYQHTYNYEGAEEYHERTLQLVRKLDKPEWLGPTYYNLASLELDKRNFSRCLEYVDSAKQYEETDDDILSVEMFAHIGLDQYREADSLYFAFKHIADTLPQLQAYHTLIMAYSGRKLDYERSLEQLFSTASHFDSLDISYVASQIALSTGDYKRAWQYSEFLRQEANDRLINLSTHSLYRIQIERDKHEKQKLNAELHHRKQLSGIFIFISIFIGIVGVGYVLFIKNVHRTKMLEAQEKALLVSSELADLQRQHTADVERLNLANTSDSTTIQALQEQIRAGQTAARELFMDKYSWIEELGNIFLDTEASKNSANRAVNIMKKRLDSVRNSQFLPQLVDVINHYRNNIIARITAECPSISETEMHIIALMCANLSTRIISFILDVKPQSIYNAKSSVKKKLESANPELLRELSDVFRVNC